MKNTSRGRGGVVGGLVRTVLVPGKALQRGAEGCRSREDLGTVIPGVKRREGQRPGGRNVRGRLRSAVPSGIPLPPTEEKLAVCAEKRAAV